MIRKWWDNLPRRGWERDAACAGMDPAPFFSRTPDKAKRICARCPVADDCLVATLRVEPPQLGSRCGIFGGMNPGERQHFGRTLEAHGITVGENDIAKWLGATARRERSISWAASAP